ncbi:MAG TPA: CopL family metal-binding regulatory protein, partial [Tahibacter sp.]|uniref:CopL family metal-binding regulatory protein n=1 Tax=Tahibacter sp. TaxID=2056211 RepID=UPI002CF684BF
MPRLAVRLLLALVLCLNGFLAPVAMAAHADAAAVEAAAAQPPCHGDEAANAADEAGHADSGSCCQPGHCLCACVFSVSLPFAPGAGASPVRGRLA